MSKTKAELMEELDEAKATVKKLEVQLKEAEALVHCREEATRTGKRIKAFMDGLIEAGLTEKQAWDIIKEAIRQSGNTGYATGGVIRNTRGIL